MYLKKTPNPNGRIRLSIVDKYYDKKKKCSRQKTIESLGFLDELEKNTMILFLIFHNVWNFLTNKRRKSRLQSNSRSMIPTDYAWVTILGRTLATLHLVRYITSLRLISS